jgi:acetoin:2,6-dichlorophenolindophenol oxidoreductase subunit alpha
LSERAAGYGMPGRSVDGNDLIAVYQAASWARAEVRRNGPVLLVCNTYRQKGHSKSDANRYRTKEEIEEWRQRDPIPRVRSYLEDKGILTSDELDAIERKAREEIEQAVEFAQAAAYPSIDTILDDVYA